jgi:hypothetical protein
MVPDVTKIIKQSLTFDKIHKIKNGSIYSQFGPNSIINIINWRSKFTPGILTNTSQVYLLDGELISRLIL